MKKIILRVLAASIAFVIIGVLFTFTSAFVGNPVSKAIATHKINAYVEKNFNDMDLSLTKTTYNFKDSGYYAKAQSKTSIDTHFHVSYSNGKVTDTYKEDVLGGFNTYIRLDQEFNDIIESLIEKNLSYEYDMIIAELSKGIDLITNILPLDMELDTKHLPVDGSITVYLYSEDISWENVAKVSLELDQLMKTNDIKIKQYSVILEPKSEIERKNGESKGIYDFPAEMLTQDNLPSVMEKYFMEWEKAGEKEKNAEMNSVK